MNVLIDLFGIGKVLLGGGWVEFEYSMDSLKPDK